MGVWCGLSATQEVSSMKAVSPLHMQSCMFNTVMCPYNLKKVHSFKGRFRPQLFLCAQYRTGVLQFITVLLIGVVYRNSKLEALGLY